MSHLPFQLSWIFAYTNVTDEITIQDETWTDITFHVEDEKINITHSISTDTEEFTIIAPGYYIIDANLGMEDSSAGDTRSLRINVNGTQIDRTDKTPQNAIDSHQIGDILVMSKLAKDDVITLQAYQDSGGTRDVVSGSNISFIKIYQLR